MGHGFRGFSPWSAGSKTGASWQRRVAQLRKQRIRQEIERKDQGQISSSGQVLMLSPPRSPPLTARLAIDAFIA